jgi:hypothetical protein
MIRAAFLFFGDLAGVTSGVGAAGLALLVEVLGFLSCDDEDAAGQSALIWLEGWVPESSAGE